MSFPANATPFAGGDGTAGDPYQISTVEQLQNMNSGPSANYILINDIDASVTSGWNSGAGFKPIGNYTNKFTGNFEGQDHEITGLYINRPTTEFVGLFGWIDVGSEINNVGLTDINITGKNDVGGLAGGIQGNITLSYALGDVSGTFDRVGGLVGNIYFGYVDQSYSTGNVTGTVDYVGGLVGWNEGSVTQSYSTSNVINSGVCTGGLVGLNQNSINDSYSTGNVNVTGYYAGSLVGANIGSLNQSYSTGNVTSNTYYVGGLTGYSEGSVDQSYSTGSVTGFVDIGGLVGWNYYGSVTQSYSTSSVVGGGTDSRAGGLVGENAGPVDSSYSTGSVVGNGANVGGLIGQNYDSVTKSHWDTETSGLSTSAGGTGNTTAEMNLQATYVGWDFTSLWAIASANNGGYPCLLSNPAEVVTAEPKTSLLAVPLNTIDFDFASSTYVEGINVEFNTSTSDVNLTLMSTMNIVKLTGAKNNDVWVNVLVDGDSVLEEKMRTLSKDRRSYDEGSTGTKPVSISIASSGTHTIIYEFRRTGNGAVGVNDIDISLVKFTTAEGNMVRKQLTEVDYTHSSSTFSDSFNWSVNKTVESGTFVIGKFTLESIQEASLQYYYKEMNSAIASPSWARYMENSDDVGSVAGIVVDSNETTAANYSIFSQSNSVDTDVDGTILDFDLKDANGSEISSFSVSNDSTDTTSDITLLSGTHLLATKNVTLYNGSGYFLSMTSSFSSESEKQTPTYFIDCTEVPAVYSKKERYLNSNTDIGNSYIYFTTDGLTQGESYNFNLWVTVEDGESLVQIDENFAGFEISEFDITSINTAPMVAIIAPEPDANISGSFYVNASITDNNGDVYISNFSLSNTTGEVLSYDGLFQGNLSVVIVSTQFTDGNYNITWKACENESTELLSADNVIEITIDNTVPFISFNDETTDAGNFSQDWILGNLSFSDSWINSSAIDLYNSSGLVGSSTSGVSPHSYNFTSLADGSYQMNASVWDFAGNINYTETRGILLDTAEPSIDHGVGTPSGNFSQDWILGNVTAMDSYGVSHLTISLYNNSGLVDSNTTEVSNSLTSNFTGLSDGTYYLNSTVEDLAGNINTTSTLTIILDTTMPVIDFNDETTDAGNFSQDWILGNLIFSDAWINSSAIYLYNSSGLVGSSTSGVSPHSYNFTSLADGSYQMNASVWDFAGNINYTETRGILLDTAEPSIDHGVGTPSGNFSQDWIFGNVTAIDSYGLSSLTISLYNNSGLVESNATEVSNSLVYNFTGLSDDTYYLNSTVEDLAGNVNTTSTLAITLDSTMPVIDFNDETTDAGNFSQFWILGNLSFSDSWINSSAIYLYNSSGLVGSSTSGVSPHSYNFTSLADGSYQMNASVWDFAGNVNKTETRHILLDTAEPSIDHGVGTPSGNFSQDWILGNVTAMDSYGLSSLTISLYNISGLVDSNTTEVSNSLTYNFIGLSDGTYYLNSTVEDLAGNVNTTSTLTITLDSTMPVIDFNDGATDAGNFSQDWILGNLSFSDSWINSSAIYLYNSSGLVGSSTSGVSPHSYNFTSLADGSYQMNASVWDFAGNINYTETRGILLDTAEPSIDHGVGTPSGNFSQDWIFGNVTAIDSYGLSSLTISLYNNSGLVESNATEVSNSLVYNFTGLSDDTYYLNSTVEDLAGNVNTTSTLAITLDSTMPVIDFNDETTDAGNFSQFWILGNLSFSDSWINSSAIYLYNSSGLVGSSTSGVSPHSYNFTSLADGSYQMNASVWDFAGNVNKTETRHILLDTAEPAIDHGVGTPSGNFSQDWILGNLSFSDSWINSSAIYLYNSSGLVGSSTSGVSPHSYNFTSLADGSYQMNASVWDFAGNINYTETRGILLDTAEPSIDHGVGTPSGNFSQDWILGNVTAMDSYGVSHLTISLYNNSGLVDSNTTEVSNSLTSNFTGLSDGTYYLNSTVEDLAGNVNTTSTLTITLDSTMPVIDFNDETTDAGNFSQDWILGNLSFSDFWINSSAIYLYNSSGLVGSSTSGVSPHSYNFTSLADGSYQMNASVWDFAGNVNKTETRHILLDTAEPAIDHGVGTPSGNFSQDWILGNLSFSDSWINSSAIYLYNSSGLVGSSTSGVSPHSYNFTSLADGSYQMNASVWDFAGNINYTETRGILLDINDPEITFDASTLEIGNHSQDWIFGNVTASDNLGIANITFYLYNSTGLFNSTSYSGNDMSMNFTSLPSGIYYLNVSVEDLAGNIVMTDTKMYGIDAIDMEITNVGVASLSDNSAIITWDTNENANSTVYYGLDANLTMNVSKTLFIVDHRITLDNLGQNTLYYYKVESYDMFGFNNSSKIGTFTTDIKKSTGGGSGGSGGFNYYSDEPLENPEGDNEPCGSVSEGTKAVNVGSVQAGDTVKVSTTEYVDVGDCMVTGLDIDMKNNVDDMGVIITQSSSSS
ncbi:Ig-like domain repeat protein [Methanococcoides alaskense]|uniref:Ig-like domain-containing protein n=1 Tax=Methanococcoides alaskense TaxID=325778 RepID=A0AA90U059_9EURY|nr:Ig-like domain repeat protein [Methanococcoides alaskense]MDA0524439.1 Ig-like domain repeat protein [Methanococcoides alaskense]MDR6223257.1 hypothetical protein [Methanococcoides alaskense]